jgi:hypothetical protein
MLRPYHADAPSCDVDAPSCDVDASSCDVDAPPRIVFDGGAVMTMWPSL